MKAIIFLLLISIISACNTTKKLSNNSIKSELNEFFSNANKLNINGCKSKIYLQCASEKESKDDFILRDFLNGLTKNKSFKKLEITNIEWQSDTAFLTTQVYFDDNKPTVIYKADERTEVNDNQILIIDKRILWVRNAQTHFFIFPECSESKKMKIVKK